MSKIKHSNLAKARAGLIITQPFFASLLLPMPITEDSSIPTMATDGDSILYNPEWTDSLTLEETTFVLAHETLHCVFDHMGRRGSRTPNRWNQAADYLINDLLIKDKIGKMPKGGLHNPQLVAAGKETDIGIYNLIPVEDEQKGCGQPGGAMDQVRDAGSEQGTKPVDAATAAQKSAEMKVKVIQARNIAKMQGKLSAGVERLVEGLIQPKVDWKEELRKFAMERTKTDYTFARPKRRFLSQDLYLPSLSGEKVGEITVGVDCSGSVTNALLAAFSAEIKAICEDVKPSKLHVIYFDSRVCHTESFELGEEIRLKMHGGGGTAFSPVFKHIDKQIEQPIAVVMLTDLECDDFGKKPDYPVLWACIDKRAKQSQVPFGEVIFVDVGGN